MIITCSWHSKFVEQATPLQVHNDAGTSAQAALRSLSPLIHGRPDEEEHSKPSMLPSAGARVRLTCPAKKKIQSATLSSRCEAAHLETRHHSDGVEEARDVQGSKGIASMGRLQRLSWYLLARCSWLYEGLLAATRPRYRRTWRGLLPVA